MGHEIKVEGSSKEEKYINLIPQIKALLEGEADMVARMSNTVAALHSTFGFLWTGFYRVTDTCEDTAAAGTASPELVVGPFQGPVACSRIAYGKGVCGTAWKEGRTLVVPDVDLFPGHIRCSSAARSEIVVPVFGPDVRKSGPGIAGYPSARTVTAVLDIDSASPGTFNMTDAHYLEMICRMCHIFTGHI